MLSFADFRKSSLEKQISDLSIQEVVSNHFDILRLELLEGVKLPSMLFEHNVLANSAYENARRGDCEDNKEILNVVLEFYKNNLLLELEVAPTSDAKADITLFIKNLVNDLKRNIAGILKVSRPTGPDAEPEDSAQTGDMAARGAPSNAGTPSGTSGGATGRSVSPSHTSFVGATTQPNAKPSNPYVHQPVNRNGGATAPAKRKWWSRPEGGYSAAIKRSMIDPVVNWAKDKAGNFKKRWWNEHFFESQELLETLFAENADQVLKLIDDFEVNLLKYLGSHLDKTAGTPSATTAAPTASPAATPSLPPGIAPLLGRGEDMGEERPTVAPTPMAARGLETAPEDVGRMAPAPAAPLSQPMDSLPKDEQEIENVRRSALAQKGAQLLGIKINDIGRNGGLTGIRQGSFVDDQNGPISAKWKALIIHIAQKVYGKIQEIDPDFIESYRNSKRETGARGTTGLKDRIKIVNSWTGNQANGWNRNGAIDLLASYYKKSKSLETPASSEVGAPSPETQPLAAGEASPTAPQMSPTAPSPAVAATPRPTPAKITKGIEAGWPKNPQAFVKKLQLENPDLWNRMVRFSKSQGELDSETEINSWIDDAMKEVGDPKELYDLIANMDFDVPSEEKTVDQKKEAPTQSSEVFPNNSVDSDRSNRIKAVKQALGDDTLDDEELGKIIGDFDPNMSDIDKILSAHDARENSSAPEAPKPEVQNGPETAAQRTLRKMRERGKGAEMKPQGGPMQAASVGSSLESMKDKPEFKQKMDKFTRLVRDNVHGDEDSAQNIALIKKRTADLKAQISDAIEKGEDPMGILDAAIDKEIQIGDNPESWIPPEQLARSKKGEPKISGRSDNAGNSSVDSLQGMRRENFDQILNRFRSVIRA